VQKYEQNTQKMNYSDADTTIHDSDTDTSLTDDSGMEPVAPTLSKLLRKAIYVRESLEVMQSIIKEAPEDTYGNGELLPAIHLALFYSRSEHFLYLIGLEKAAHQGARNSRCH